jgi:hypothetical protein
MDLGNAQNWQLILSGTKRVTNRREYASVIVYDRIPEIRIRVVSPIISINLESESANPRWRTGAWASFYVPARGNNYAMSESGKFCKLNDETLLIFNQPTEAIPYSLALNFPWWLEDVAYQVWQYVDDSGRYFASTLLERLTDMVEGQTITLQTVRYSFVEGQPDLIVSTFIEPVKYDRYEVGRFYLKDSGANVPDPVIDKNPKQLVVSFTSELQFLPDSITVRITPIRSV